MKKNKRLLGIKNHYALDYVLAVLFAIVSLGAIWLAVWITTKSAYTLSGRAWQNFIDAFTLKFEKSFSWQGLICSSIAYLGIFSAIVLIFASLIKRSFRGVVGAINVMFASTAGSLFFSFFYTFANPVSTKVSGMLPVGLAVVCALLLYFAKLSIDLSISYMNEKNEKPEEKQEIIKYIYVNNANSSQQEPEEEFYKDYPVVQPQEEYEEQQFEEAEDLDIEEPEEEPEEEPVEIQSEDKLIKINAKKYTFTEKLERATKDVRYNYKDLMSYFEELGFKCKVAKHSANFYYKNMKYASITVSGKSALRVYFKLDYAKYENTSMPLVNVADVKKYEKTPVYIKVKSDLSLKRAKTLIEDLELEVEE